MARLRMTLALTLATLSVVGCDDGSDAEPMATDPGTDPGSRSEGAQIFSERIEDGNTFTCATCHAIWEPTEDGLRRPGHPVGDAAARPSFKNGAVAELRDAVNSCLTEWMNADPWTEDDPRWIALSDYFDELAPADAAALDFEIVPPPADLDGGDPELGQQTFNATCSVCHGIDGGGTQKAPPIAGLSLDAGYIAERVRHSGRANSEVYDGLTGGIMPFWSADRLSDDELRDIIAWLVDSEPAPQPVDPDTGDGGTGDAGDSGDGGMPPGPTDGGTPPSGCGATHPKVGQTAILQEAFHDVGGTAEILDDCTIEIRDFTFDGTGVNVQLYGGLGGNYGAGFSMRDDIRRDEPYAGETLTLTLPAGVTLDDLDGVSVWCVPVGIDFGSGMFQ